MENKTQITCPNCGTEINVNDILYKKLEGDIKQKFQFQVEDHRKKYKDAMKQVKEKELLVLEQKEQFDLKLQETLNEHLNTERVTLTATIKSKLEEEKSMQVIEHNRTKAKVEQLKREKDELEEKIKYEAQKELNTLLDQERQKIHKHVEDQNEFKLKEKEKQLNELKQKLEEARRKAEQGSQQTQGEVQELAIEEWLALHFPFDSIEEIKKGMKGADCIQTVNTREIQNCGTIYYESKRTKDFQKSWIEKFKVDIREKGADVGVLITETLPKEYNAPFFQDQ